MQCGKVFDRRGIDRPGQAVIQTMLTAMVGFCDEAGQTIAFWGEDPEQLRTGGVQHFPDGVDKGDFEFGTVTLSGYGASVQKHPLLRCGCTGLGNVERGLVFRHAIRRVEILCT